jgi:flagellar protein FlbD
MIWLTRTDHHPFALNCDLVEFIGSTPDTVITMTTGQKVRVSETADEVVSRIMAYRKSLNRGVTEMGGAVGPSPENS